MNTTTLERKLKTSQTNYKRYETLIQNLTEQRHQVRAPYAKQIETLQTKMEVVSEGIRKRLRQAEIKHGQKEAEVRTLTRNIIMKRYQDVVPSVDEFLVLARYTEFFLEPGDDSTECGLMEIKRYNLDIPGFVIKACGDKYGSDRFYFAWKKNKLVGIMVVHPSRHPGDSTTADAIVYGKRRFKDEYVVNAPVTQFENLLKKGK